MAISFSSIEGLVQQLWSAWGDAAKPAADVIVGKPSIFDGVAAYGAISQFEDRSDFKPLLQLGLFVARQLNAALYVDTARRVYVGRAEYERFHFQGEIRLGPQGEEWLIDKSDTRYVPPRLEWESLLHSSP